MCLVGCRYAAFFGWSLAIWVSYGPLINGRQQTDNSSSQKTIDTLAKLLFGLMLSAAVLLFEKVSIQWIAGKFHERSYAGAAHSSLQLTPTQF